MGVLRQVAVPSPLAEFAGVISYMQVCGPTSSLETGSWAETVFVSAQACVGWLKPQPRLILSVAKYVRE